MRRCCLAWLACCLTGTGISLAAEGDTQAPASAKELASKLSAIQQGSAYVRLLMEIKDAPGAGSGSLQLQIKERREHGRTDLVYQVLWPKERKGEAVLLHQEGGGAASGSLFQPPGTLHELSGAQMGEPLFGSELTYEDAVENFFGWPEQSLAGNEVVNRVNCVVLDSRPGGAPSLYGHVKSWIDPRRLVPLRVEKYLPSGRLVRRIETTRVANDDLGRPIPANLTVTVEGKPAVTNLDGSRIKHGVSFSDQDFSPEGLKQLTPPH